VGLWIFLGGGVGFFSPLSDNSADGLNFRCEGIPKDIPSGSLLYVDFSMGRYCMTVTIGYWQVMVSKYLCLLLDLVSEEKGRKVVFFHLKRRLFCCLQAKASSKCLLKIPSDNL